MKHFATHASDGEGAMPMPEVDRLCVTAANLTTRASTRKLGTEKARQVEREMAAYMEMWADAY